jgi:hypothetical protein
MTTAGDPVANEHTATHRWVVDSIEESVASVEVDGSKMMTIPLSMLPKAAREGHILCVTIEVDAEATQKALAESAAQVKKGASKSKDPGGDITL